MANYWKIVNSVINRSDIVLEILDARMIDETRNAEAEKKVRNSKARLIYVINKADLVDKEALERVLEDKKKELNPCVFISAKNRLGSKILRDQIMIEASRMKTEFPIIRVGVIGYPNTGKSSVINMLKGRKSAPTSSYSGYTKGIQEVRATKRITLYDTPGVIPFMEKDETKHSMISSKNVQHIKDPEKIYYDLFDKLKELGIDLLKHYGIRRSSKTSKNTSKNTNQKGSKSESDDDAEKILGVIAYKKRRLMKGGEPDTERIAREIIKEWQDGKIR